MRFTDDFIQRVKDSTDIVALVGEYVPLKKAGTSFKGLCPFHSEKSPSFTVSPSRNSFHCFGCGKGGNAVTFLMEMEKLAFPEALKNLAQKAGIPIPQVERDGASEARERERDGMLALHESAGKFFAYQLNAPEGKAALEYLLGKRGLTQEDVQKFALGYAPAGWDALKNIAVKKGYKPEELVAGGLLVKNEEKGTFYDKFRNRIMFPVKDNFGKIIAFGGRALSDDDNPKYLNSPETLLFKKGECLYLLDQAKDAIRKKGFSLVVEGYFDAIALHRQGFDNAVATLGTALTPQHARILRRYAGDVLLLYDADTAGQAAVLRGFEPLLVEGLKVRVLTLPDAKDPDEYLLKHSKEDLAVLMDRAPDFFRWRAAALKDKVRGLPVEQVIRALSDLVPLITRLPDEAAVQAACGAVESELKLDNRDVMTIVNAERKKKGKVQSFPKAGDTPPAGQERGSRSENPTDERVEAEFLALLSGEEGKFIPWAKEELLPGMFLEVGFRELFSGLVEGRVGAGELGSSEVLGPWFIRMEANPDQYKHREALLAELAAAIKRRSVKRRIEELKLEQDEVEKGGNLEKAATLAQEISRLKNEMTAVPAEDG